MITPRFKNGNWENDVSEIRHFRQDYFTIGHILETGLVIPYLNIEIYHKSVDEMSEQYGFNDSQKKQLRELLSEDNKKVWNSLIDIDFIL